jgi:hypothetical protein
VQLSVKSIILPMVLIALAACGPTDVTVANQTLCQELATAICTRADSCATGAEKSDPSCVDAFVTSCCSPTTCAQSSAAKRSEIDACTADIASFDCQMLGTGQLPQSCPPLPSRRATEEAR